MHDAIRAIVQNGGRPLTTRNDSSPRGLLRTLEDAERLGLVRAYRSSIGELDERTTWTLASPNDRQRATLARLGDGVIGAGHRVMSADLEWLVNAGLAEWCTVRVAYANGSKASLTCATLTPAGVAVREAVPVSP